MEHRRAVHLHPPQDVWILILAQIPDLRDKLAFASACRASRAAAKDAECWQIVNVKRAAWSAGKPLPAPDTPATSVCSVHTSSPIRASAVLSDPVTTGCSERRVTNQPAASNEADAYLQFFHQACKTVTLQASYDCGRRIFSPPVRPVAPI